MMKKLFALLLAVLCLTCVCFAEGESTFEAPAASEAKATWTDDTETFEGTFGECILKANEKGGTVTMLDDVKEAGDHPTMRNDIDDADYIVGSNKVFTLDMNGHTLYTEPNGAIYVNGGEEGGIFVVKNGTIISLTAENIYVANCGLQALNVTMRSKKSQNISFYDATGKYNKDNLIEGCTIVNTIWHCLSFNSQVADQSAASVTIINSTLGCFKSAAPLGAQSKAMGGNVVLGEGVVLAGYSTSPAKNIVELHGEPIVKTEKDVSISFEELDLTVDFVNLWYTSETPTMNIADVIPGDGEATMENSPALRKVTIVPQEGQEDAEKTDAPAASEQKTSGIGVVPIIVIVAVVAAAVVLVILKKKKK